MRQGGAKVKPGRSRLKGGLYAVVLAVLVLGNSGPARAQAPAAAAPAQPPASRFQQPLSRVAQAALNEQRAPLERMTPVTAAMLANPDSADWLHWRRTYNGWGYSPIKQINRSNVRNLQVFWTLGMGGSGITEYTPVVHDGIMFLWSFGEIVQAVDATNGTVLWQYTHRLPADHKDVIPSGFDVFKTKRSLAIGDNKVIVTTADMHILALDAKTGRVSWDVVTDDYHSGRTYPSGALVVRDKVIVGAGNCSPGTANSGKGYFPPGGCFITAHDLATGKLVWRFNTVARPDEAGGETWNSIPAEKRGGGATWMTGQYDPELKLTYWGTGNPSPWSNATRGTGVEKTRYNNSTLALDPDTGKLVWFYQHLGPDAYDPDYAFERIVAPVEFQGRRVKAVLTVGKPGIFEAVDAATGKFLFARDPGGQNVVTAIDPVSGAKTLLPEPVPAGVSRCPSNGGLRGYPAGAYSPDTQRYYLPAIESCMEKMGDTTARFLALDLRTQEFVLDIRSRLPQSSALVATAGGLIFAGTADRYFRAYDDRTGKLLWQSPRMQDIPGAFPITYAVDGKQYVAMAVGNAGYSGLGAAPELGRTRAVSTSVLWVWQLPRRGRGLQ
jgi:alcohol dehydrogenase (cytochrome c)